jgi:hypothetical protein
MQVLVAHRLQSWGFSRGESVKRRYEYQPGLFGLASVAAGCAVKPSRLRTQADPMSAGEDSQIEAQSESESENGKNFDSGNQKQNRE